LLVVGTFSIFKAMNALEDVSQSQSKEVAKGLAHMANLAVQEEMKISAQVAQNAMIINGAAEHAEGVKDGAQAQKATEELTAIVKRSGTDYEAFFVAGLDGKVIADGQGGKNKGLDLSERDYVKEAKNGKVSVGSVTKSKGSGNIVLTFGAPIYSKSNQVIGVVGSVINISFLSDKISAVKMGKTGYAYVINKSGLVIAHPNKDLILVLNALEQEGMKGFAERMIAGETGVDPYVFKGIKKVAGFAPVPLAGWSVCVTQDYDEFLAPAYNLMWFIIIIGLIFLAGAVVGVYFFARGIALPVGQVVI